MLARIRGGSSAGASRYLGTFLHPPNCILPFRRGAMLQCPGAECQTFFPAIEEYLAAQMEGASQPGEVGEFGPEYARIRAQSRRQAMDWSLVLASQDIHPIIEGPEGPKNNIRDEPFHSMAHPPAGV